MIPNKFLQLIAGLGLCSTACGVYATPTHGNLVARKGSNTPACASVSSLSASQVSATPNAAPVVPAELAVACLQSIPNKKQEALNLTGSWRAYLEFQSDKGYLTQPPPGYLNPAYNIDAFLNQTEDNVRKGKYKSELEFQQDLFYTLQQAFDGHLFFQSDILNTFTFSLDTGGLVSVSPDGIQLPEVYFVGDVFSTNSIIESSSLVPLNITNVSAVTSINGVAIDEALQTIGLFGQFQDPDARYNTLLISPSALGGALGTGLAFTFSNLGNVPNLQSFYNFTFANGSTTQVPLRASVNANFTGVTDGETAYEAFAPFAQFPADEINGNALISNASTTGNSSSSSTSEDAISNSTVSTNIPFFPYPIVKDSANTIAGYFLNGTDFSDTAVLQLVTFEPPSNDTEEYTKVLTTFLEQAVSQNKTKLIIDVQSNNGGSIDLGTFVVGQLFPNIAPNAKSNMVRSVGLDAVVRQASSDVASTGGNATAEATTADQDSPFDFQDNITPTYEDFASAEDFLDGTSFDGSNFTSFFQTNFTSPVVDQIDGFVVFNGSANAKPPFAPENVVVLSNGACTSTCTVFSEHLKNQAGVRFIAAGGRPIIAPMQAVGGVKGAQIFNFQAFSGILQIFDEVLSDNSTAAIGKEAPWSDFGYLPIARSEMSALSDKPLAGLTNGGVNGRNSFRIGDNSSTPLQYVYEAADCRIWFTTETLASPASLWERTAQVAFTNGTNGPFDSPFCVAGSTNQPTSSSGGLKQGQLGPQVYNATIAGQQIFANAPWAKNASSNDVVKALGFIPSISGKEV